MFKRIFLIVMDSLGVGQLPDSHNYGDQGAHTLKHIAEEMDNEFHQFNIPNLEKLGIGSIPEIGVIKNVKVNDKNLASIGKLKEKSVGKDTLTGHLEIMGLETTVPFKTFTETGFPKELLDEITKISGRNILGNVSASGTEILEELGEEHMKTGDLIVYTSADSVLQIAAHEEIVPLEELYRICKLTREITLDPKWKVARIIARPFLGTGKGKFKRTPNRHDYALKPYDKTVLDYLKSSGLEVISVGKINDIFDGEGITKAYRTISNEDGMEKTIEIAKQDFIGLNFVNLVDFDALYGHRRDPIGYGKSIERFDIQLGQLLSVLKENDLLIITADHGTDPVHKGTDHTREYIPLIVYNKQINNQVDLGIGDTFADIGATIGENFKVKAPKIGTSFLQKLNS